MKIKSGLELLHRFKDEKYAIANIVEGLLGISCISLNSNNKILSNLIYVSAITTVTSMLEMFGEEN